MDCQIAAMFSLQSCPLSKLTHMSCTLHTNIGLPNHSHIGTVKLEFGNLHGLYAVAVVTSDDTIVSHLP